MLLTIYIKYGNLATMKLLDEIPYDCKELLGKAVAEGDWKASMAIASDPSFLVGVGIDNRARYHHQDILESLQRCIRTSRLSGLTAETVCHSKGHALRIRVGRYVIFPRRLRNRYAERPEPQYHRPYILQNPTRQNDLFDPYADNQTTIIAHLLFGKDSEGLFALLSIPDSAGGIYEAVSLPVEFGTLAVPTEALPVEKAPLAAIGIKHDRLSSASGA
jgi:hypothetical protein